MVKKLQKISAQKKAGTDTARGPLAGASFWLAAALATLLPATARFDDGWRWFQRLFVHGLKSLVGPLIDFFKIARVKRRRPAQGKGARYWARTLALPLAESALILVLFSAANPLIEQFFTALDITAPEETLIVRMILWGFLGLITWGVLRPRPPGRADRGAAAHAVADRRPAGRRPHRPGHRRDDPGRRRGAGPSGTRTRRMSGLYPSNSARTY